MPKISVIIPNYNHAAYLEQRIHSVLNQTYNDFEVILMDDCSTDGSVEILKKYEKHPQVSKLLLNKQNSGSAFRQWKKGVEQAEGKYVWIAESDDYADVQFLESLIPILEEGCSLAYCRSFKVRDTEVDSSNYFWPDMIDRVRWRKDYIMDGNEEIKNYLAYRNTIPNASACVFDRSKAAFDRDILDMRYCGDWLFWARIIQNSKIGFTSKKLNYFRMHANTTRVPKPLQQGVDKYKEYIKVVKEIREIAALGSIKYVEIKQYDWILKELMNSTNKKMNYTIFSILPLPLLFRYSYFITK